MWLHGLFLAFWAWRFGKWAQHHIDHWIGLKFTIFASSNGLTSAKWLITQDLPVQQSMLNATIIEESKKEDPGNPSTYQSLNIK